MIIRRFVTTDAQPLSRMIAETVRTSNAKDYPKKTLDAVLADERPEDLLERSRDAHFYVAEDSGTIVGCAAVRIHPDIPDACYITTVFVLPGMQKKGVGRKLMEALESDEIFRNSRLAKLKATITGLGFYRALGWKAEDGIRCPNADGLWLMEKEKGGTLSDRKRR